MAAAIGNVAKKGSKTLSLLLGTCVPCVKKNASKIRIRRLTLDQNLLMYFKKDEFYYAHDPQILCKPGDTVLIKELPSKLTRLISHEVLEVVYPFGDVTDPITGKKVTVGKYRDDIAEDGKLFGATESAFDYDKAPPRGSQRDKRDFSYEETYVKYHEYPDKSQPYSV